MQLQKRHALQILTLCAALTLSACGGGGSSSATTNNTSTPAGSTDTPSSGGTSGGTTSGTNSGGTTPSGGGGTPTPTAAECPIGDYKSAVHAQINAIRASAQSCGGVSYPAAGPLSWNSQLEYAAEVHSNDMAVNNYFDHPDANGVRIGGRASAAGYSYGTVGENIAAGHTSVSSVFFTGDAKGWMTSSSHCANMMFANFVHVAVSCKYNENSAYKYYWTLTLGHH